MYLKYTKNKNGRTRINIMRTDYVKGKNKTKTVKNLGYLDEYEEKYEDPIAHLNKILEEMNRKEQEGKNQTITLNMNESLKPDENNLYNLGYVPIKKIFGELELNKCLNSINKRYRTQYCLSHIVLFLVISRLIKPSSILKAFASRDKYFEDFKFSLHDIYRSYDVLAKNQDEIKKHLYEMVNEISPYQTDRVRYDVTNYYFEIRYDDKPEFDEEGNPINKAYRKKGPSKEHRKTGIIQLGLLIDKRGIPMDYHLFPGNESEKVHFLPFIREMKKKHNVGRVVVVADRGLNTHDNTIRLAWQNNQRDIANDGYIFGQSVRTGTDEFKNWVLNQDDYRIDPKIIDGKAYTTEIDPETKEERVIGFKHKSRVINRFKNIKGLDGKKHPVEIREKELVYFSQRCCDRENFILDQMIEKAENIEKNPAAFNQKTHFGILELMSGFELDKKTKTFKDGSKPYVDKAKIDEKQKFNGYFGIITSEIEMSDQELRGAYKELSEIEHTFRISKTDLKFRPVYVSLEDHIEAHFLICYISLLILRLLHLKLRNSVPCEQLLDAMRNYNCVHLKDHTYMFLFYNQVIETIGKELNIDFTKKYRTRQSIKKLVKY